MNTVYTIGIIAGTLFGGKLMQSGRKKAFIVACLIGLSGSCLTFIIDWRVFLVAKTICGLFDGMITVVTGRFIEEYVPTAYYGVCAAVSIMAICFGTFSASLLGLILPPDDDKEALYSTKLFYVLYSL